MYISVRYEVFLIGIVALLLSACVAKYEVVSLPYFAQKSFIIKSGEKQFFLYIAHNDESYQFALFDMFGAPILSKVLKDGRFNDMKFLPPNSQYDSLFVEILSHMSLKNEDALVSIIEGKKVEVINFE